MRKPPANKGKSVVLAWLRDHVAHEDDACLPWPFFRDPYYGRGRVGVGRKNKWAHRLMCEMAHGEPPTPKHQAAHSCGNGTGGCVNPRHLSWKTNSENQKDRRLHGTQLGAKGSRTRLTTEQIADIRASKGSEPQLKTAERYGVKRGTIEYWQKLKRDRRPAGSSTTALWRRKKTRVAPSSAGSEQMTKKARSNSWGDLEPLELRRACSVMACGDGWKSFVAARYGDKWIFKDHGVPLTVEQQDGGCVLVERDDFYALAVEYGYSRLKSIFHEMAEVA